MARVSVMICCANVANTIEAACRSAAWADELVVVDSGSTDATGDIAKRFATRYVVEPWRGYTEQKRFGVSLCRNEWVLVLDGDEECSPELGDEIGRLPDAVLERHDLFLMRRRNYIMGRYVRVYSPDWQNRLIHRGRCRWADEVLHDTRTASHPSRVGKLRGRLEHNRYRRAGFSEYFNGRMADERLRLLADDLTRRGRRCRWGDLVLRPMLAFLKLYLLKGGFRDGMFGLLIAQRAAIAVQLKYSALWALQEGYTRTAGVPDATSPSSCGAASDDVRP